MTSKQFNASDKGEEDFAKYKKGEKGRETERVYRSKRMTGDQDADSVLKSMPHYADIDQGSQI